MQNRRSTGVILGTISRCSSSSKYNARRCLSHSFCLEFISQSHDIDKMRIMNLLPAQWKTMVQKVSDKKVLRHFSCNKGEILWKMQGKLFILFHILRSFVICLFPAGRYFLITFYISFTFHRLMEFCS